MMCLWGWNLGPFICIDNLKYTTIQNREKRYKNVSCQNHEYHNNNSEIIASGHIVENYCQAMIWEGKIIAGCQPDDPTLPR